MVRRLTIAQLLCTLGTTSKGERYNTNQRIVKQNEREKDWSLIYSRTFVA
jgi:hypothetical protein